MPLQVISHSRTRAVMSPPPPPRLTHYLSEPRWGRHAPSVGSGFVGGGSWEGGVTKQHKQLLCEAPEGGDAG